MANTEIDSLVPDLIVAEELSVTTMTLYRWDRDPAKAALGWPPKIKPGGPNGRTERQISGDSPAISR
jgi:hypothetical protein